MLAEEERGWVRPSYLVHPHASLWGELPSISSETKVAACRLSVVREPVTRKSREGGIIPMYCPIEATNVTV